ncbi:bacteriophage N4 receptor, outer membrane subunit [Marinobacter litoralis]|uniref:Bacteriophage N4 receptor, outer membrane subunit n=1 Tax=Marinobacter litoralis TaxID=187981 RepID=A0A3M2RJN3_9GAMM|nr:tetratricopeptide repeat protein [Marinobacter litoralis]RMJ05444.1 bacteriophage N4 receptor, outer membrane subunit [Marinobacter litoralis]
MQRNAPYLATCLLGITFATLSGCSSFSGSSTQPTPEPVATPAPEQTDIEYADFEPEVLYQLLSAEIAAQRGRYDVTLVNYIQAAKTSRDDGVIERAMRIAQTLNADNAQQQLADLWLEKSPDNIQAHRVAAIQAVKRQNLEKALLHMEKIMDQGEDADFDSLAAMATQLPPAQQQELLTLYLRLAERHPNTPDLEYGIALLMKVSGDPQSGLERLESLISAHPNFQPAITLKGDLLYQTGQTKAALNHLTTNTRRFPDNRQMGTLYGRILINEKKLQAAQDEFQRLITRHPETPGLKLSHALVALENQQPDVARADLQALVDQGHHTNEAKYYLGRIEEEAGNTELAINLYQSVESGNYYFPALSRASELQAQAGELNEALSHIQALRANNPEQAEKFWLLEINLLIDQDKKTEALAATNTALAEHPKNVEARYARAMLLDANGKSEQAEQDLKAILDIEPTSSITLNALGYILTERTDRLQEAQGYIERALALDPDNPAILDSMGWVLFKQGRTMEALNYLSEAWGAYPDPEVSAHYGEALWSIGEEEQARIVWEEGLDKDPDHEILLETIERLTNEGSEE